MTHPWAPETHPAGYGREIDDLMVLDALLASGSSLAGARLENLDLTPVADALLERADLAGLVVLGGVVPGPLARHLLETGAVVFPSDPRAPVDVYRTRLYRPDELYAGLDEGYAGTPDALAYAWTRDAQANDDHYVAVLRALHDDSVLDALDDLLTRLGADGRTCVGVMGGHALARGSAGYADAARLGRALARAGHVVVTGGGPGAMEAANLGAMAGAAPDHALDEALQQVASVPGFRPSIDAWVAAGLAARAGLRTDGSTSPQDGRDVTSIGIPTWFYGHEPPNVFCDGIAKLFSNAVREDVLLDRCRGGIVVLPGAAGTVQEIFQASTRLFYAVGPPLAPLVLVGRDAWTRDVPAWHLLETLGAGRPMAEAIHLVETVDEAAAVIG